MLLRRGELQEGGRGLKEQFRGSFLFLFKKMKGMFCRSMGGREVCDNSFSLTVALFLGMGKLRFLS